MKSTVMKIYQRGMSLVEILVAVAIGLIGILIITQAYITSDNFNRTTLGEGGAQTNGTIALFTLERELRMAGYGIANSAALGCGNINYYRGGQYSANLGGPLPNIQVAPVVIATTPGAPDQVTVMYSTTSEAIVPTTLSKSMPNSSSILTVDGTAGFEVPDLVLMVNKNPPQTCTLMEVTSVSAPSSNIAHDPGGGGFNPAGGGLFPAYQKDDFLFNLGVPRVRSYAIVNNNLRLTDMAFASPASVTYDLVDGIVDLRAHYGKDNGVNNNTVTNALYAADDGIVDSYSSVTPVNGAEWAQVHSVRIAVLARIGTYERPTGGACTATTVMPTWSGSRDLLGSALTPFVLPEGLPSCYRYRVFETVIPLRNMIWRPA